MDDSNKGSSLKPSPIPKPSNSGAGESNENELSSDPRRGAKMHNPKKPAKHFMSPTFSAASKAAVPRKKILGERNEAPPTFSDTHSQKSPNIESRTTPLRSRNSQSGRSSPRVISSYTCASESDDDQNNAFVVDSSLKPYDPLTNYLSPRPKYLRYKPNRRREIISHLESDGGEEKDGTDVEISGSFESEKVLSEEESSADAEDSSLPPMAEEGLMKSDNDDQVVEEEEYEEEEIEEDGGCSLKGLMKFLLVIFVLFLSTSYILSMNTPTPSYTQQAISRLTYEYNRIHEHLLTDVAVKMFGDGNGSLDQVEASESGVFNVDHRIEEVHEFEKHVEMVEAIEEVDDDKGEMIETGYEQAEIMEPMDVSAHQVDVTDGAQDQPTEAENAKQEHVCDGEVKTKQEGSELDEDAVDHEMEKSIESSDLFDESEKQSDPEVVDDHDTIINTDLSETGTAEEAVEEIFEETIEFGGLVKDEVERAENSMSKTDDEIVVSRMENSPTESDTTNSQEDVEIGSVPAAITVILFSSMLASLVYVYHSRKTRAVREHSQPPQINPIEKATVTETLAAPAFPTMGENHIEKIAEPFRKPSSLFVPAEVTPEPSNHVYAPNVELLGELVFGEVSSSLRSCDRKSKMKMIESEESNDFAFQERTLPRQPAAESSSTDSPSYGSFTAERKILKKEKGKDAEVKVAVITTPVRRSSRLLNRSAMSP